MTAPVLKVVFTWMPPGGLDPQYGHFVDNFTLSQNEIDTIVKWADGGAVEGNPKDAPKPVAFTGCSSLSRG